jgi:hypothetical protein
MFLKQLSIMTGYAWTYLTMNSMEIDKIGWILPIPNPKVPNGVGTSNYFGSIINIGGYSAGSSQSRWSAIQTQGQRTG